MDELGDATLSGGTSEAVNAVGASDLHVIALMSLCTRSLGDIIGLRVSV